MGKLIGIEFIKMKHDPVTWLTALITVGQGLVHAVMLNRYRIDLVRYPKMEYAVYVYLTARVICMVSLFMAAYVIAGDFSMRTVQNVLASGIDRKKYYLSRLSAQMIFLSAAYTGGCVVFVASRIVITGTVNASMSFGEFMVFFLVMALQPMVYVSLANMISVFCKNQGVAVILSEISLFLALILRIYSMGKDFYTGFGRLKGPLACEPMYLLETCDRFVYSEAGIFSFAFIRYAFSAVIMIAVFTASGYRRLTRSNLR